MKQIVNTEQAPKAIGPYSQAAKLPKDAMVEIEIVAVQ